MDIVLVTLPTTAVETAMAQCTDCCTMVRGHCLNTFIVLAAVHGLSGLFWAVSTVEPSLSHPLPPLSPSLISNLTFVDVKQHGHGVLPCLVMMYLETNLECKSLSIFQDLVEMIVALTLNIAS